ncbi:MAG: DNA polymerase III subunit alpha [Gammaproteobacteria bacterium HGW-Gammaproteobacteria-2]|nr:MAG: DNA polymerase III subunit alpha [Gammaproteobacteria bacterium HGW-Gammaproteobacteria-2]
MTPRFVHLHLHSEFSLTDSTIRIKPMVKRCAQLGLPAVAITDQSNLFALVKFYKAAEAEGLKPIAGADIWLADEGQPPSRLSLLCRNRDGYLGLSRLLSRAYQEGHRGDLVCVKPAWLYDERSGLVVIAGRQSLLGQHLAGGRNDTAARILHDWRELFPDALYLELTRTGRDGEQAFNMAAVELADRMDLPLLASNDVRFLLPDDFEAHEARVCIASGRVLDDPKRPRDYSPEQYLENTVELAQRCNLELQLGTYYLPDFPVPDGHTVESWLRAQSEQGLAERLKKSPVAAGHTTESYQQRLAIELDVIITMGFPGYFLIVADFINWAKQHDIPVGPGRGSGAGSLVAWALGITDLDPLPYDLLFERFLNPERVSMPDFDIDFCMDRRDEVIDYVAQKYGRDRVSQIITYGTMAAKAVVRDTGRILGHPYGFVDSIAKLIPLTLGISLDDALGESEAARKDNNLASAELIARYQSEDDVRDLIDLARKLEDLTRNAGKHAGGVVIAPSPLTDFCPLFCEQGGTSPVTQFDKDDVEAAGLVKFDFLGLRTLTILDWAVKAINAERQRNGEAEFDLTALPLDDPATYALFSRGDTVAVFQFESRGMRELLKRARPDRFEDIIALAALFRPGPLGSGMDKDWTARKHGEAEVTYAHDLLKPVLAPTYGVIVYQEQVMQIAQVLAGYSLGGADLLRRAMGKKKPEEMAKERAKFEAGASARNVDPRVASGIFDLMEKFAEYGFNKSHSAAYALVAYQTAWLKVHYPAQFMAATLSSDMDNTDKVVNFLNEARALGLAIAPPDVNSSGYAFAATDAKAIRYGLGAIKGVGHGACIAIVDARASGAAFRDLPDFLGRVDGNRLNRRVLEALIHAGALDSLGSNRPSLLAQLPDVLRATEQAARERAAGQVSLFGGGPEPALSIELAHCEDWPLAQKLAGERETLGHYLSGHPLDPWRSELNALTGFDLGELERVLSQKRDRRGEAQVVIAGMVTAIRKRGETMAFVQIEDGKGQLECLFFRDAFIEYGAMLSRDRVLVIEGSLSDDDFSGGFSLRAKRCWDYRELCAGGQRLDLRIDLRDSATLEQLETTLNPHRPGTTPLRLLVTTTAGCGVIEINGAHSVRCEPELIDQLRALPAISEVSLHLPRPWQH